MQHSAAFRIQVIELLTLELAGVSCRGPEQTATATVAAFMTETSAILFRKPAAFAMMAAVAVALSSALANADQANTHQTLKSRSEFMPISSVAERSPGNLRRNRKAADASALHGLPPRR